MNDVTTIAKLADAASAHDDRWMLICAIVIVLFACAGLVKWVLSDRNEVAKRLTEITDRHIEQGAQLAALVANNTAALHRNTAVLELVCDRIQRCRAEEPAPLRHKADPNLP